MGLPQKSALHKSKTKVFVGLFFFTLDLVKKEPLYVGFKSFKTARERYIFDTAYLQQWRESELLLVLPLPLDYSLSVSKSCHRVLVLLANVKPILAPMPLTIFIKIRKIVFWEEHVLVMTNARLCPIATLTQGLLEPVN